MGGRGGWWLATHTPGSVGGLGGHLLGEERTSRGRKASIVTVGIGGGGGGEQILTKGIYGIHRRRNSMLPVTSQNTRVKVLSKKRDSVVGDMLYVLSRSRKGFQNKKCKINKRRLSSRLCLRVNGQG